MHRTPEVKYAFMKDNRDEFDLNLMAEVLGVSRSGYYNWIKREPSKKEDWRSHIKAKIEGIFLSSKKTYGSPRVYRELLAHGYNIGENTVARYMREIGLIAITKKRYKVKTTDSKHDYPVADNRLQQNFTATKPNEIWLSDLTYIRTAEGWLYLVAILDLYSRKIIGWNLSTSLEAKGTIAALDMAMKNRSPAPGLVFHSDRGVQYACGEFRGKLANFNIIQSMSRKGNCYDNSPMESFFHTFKTEHIYPENFERMTIQQAKTGVFQWIECFYNRKRRHSSIGYQAPVAMEGNNVLALAA